MKIELAILLGGLFFVQFVAAAFTANNKLVFQTWKTPNLKIFKRLKNNRSRLPLRRFSFSKLPVSKIHPH
jgi:hypothetical protein